MNGESTYEPNFVINEEDKASTEQKEFEESLKSIPPTTALKDEASIKLIDREVEFIEGQRSKLRLFDPKGVYFYRHNTISYFQSAFHIISLLVSCYLIYLLLLETSSLSKEFVQGIGWVSNITLIERMADITILVVLFVQFRGLFKHQGLSALRRYKLAMLANAINNVVINHLKLIVLFLILMMLYFFSIGSLVEADAVFEKLSNGVIADVYEALLIIISIAIIVRAFRFCNKELAE
jgi:hypothetical protein